MIERRIDHARCSHALEETIEEFLNSSLYREISKLLRGQR
jgi:hypothetical protein